MRRRLVLVESPLLVLLHHVSFAACIRYEYPKVYEYSPVIAHLVTLFVRQKCVGMSPFLCLLQNSETAKDGLVSLAGWQNSETVKDGLLSLAGNVTPELLMSMSMEELRDLSFQCGVLLDEALVTKKAEVHGISSLKGRMDKAIRRVEKAGENRANTARLADLRAECFIRVCFLCIRVRSAGHSMLSPRLTWCHLAYRNLVLTGNQGAEL